MVNKARQTRLRIQRRLHQLLPWHDSFEPNATMTCKLYPQYQIGRYTYGAPRVVHPSDGAVLKIGAFCSIAQEVLILLGGNHRIDWITTYPFSTIFPDRFGHIAGHPRSRGDVVIGNDVWIGWGATIMSGVHVGDGAVIGARSVVTRSVDPFAIVAGNPARPIGFRFDEATRHQLLKIRWWDWPDDKLFRYAKLLMSGDIQHFLRVATE